MLTLPNAQYNVADPDSIPVKIATYQRRRIYATFLRELDVSGADSIVDVGVTTDRSYLSSNYLEAWHPHKSRITAVGIDDAQFLETLYPGVKFVLADGLDLPFADRAFDITHASAVLEHVGSFERQAAFIAECARVCRRGFFMTTPNRWFPIEFHTVLPLVHWLPKPMFRELMRRTGRAFFADEANLNLMTASELRRAAAASAGEQFDITVTTANLAGWPSNLLLIGRRRGQRKPA